MPNDDLFRVWQDQPLENISMPLEEIRRKAKKFESRIHNRNRREYIAAAVVVTAFTYYIYKFSDLLVRAGSALIILGMFYIVYQLYTRSSPKTVPGDLGLMASLEFHRCELVRQRDLLSSVWSWYLGPLVPGLLVFTKGAMTKRGPEVVMYAVYGAVFGAIWWVNRRAAEGLTRQIKELDNLGGQL